MRCEKKYDKFSTHIIQKNSGKKTDENSQFLLDDVQMFKKFMFVLYTIHFYWKIEFL